MAITYSTNVTIHGGDWLKITRPDGSVVHVRIAPGGANVGSTIANHSDTFTIDAVSGHNAKHVLNWNNCYSFGNGVESNRVTDTFNNPYVTPGVRVSTVFEDYKEEHRKYGLIYSGLYNGISSTNNLNQFIQAEKITKDINPIYGSIQKIHARDTDLVTLCEDKVLKILASKDAVYNADGNPQLTANINVLGQAIPFVGEYGISKNPESFVSEAYRSYFTDKQRGTVMRLSRDGLTPISEHGMKDWFRDNLKLGNKLIGSYDDRNDEYNITIGNQTTVSFKEDVKGWVSFKSFMPENAISCANNYFTILEGKLYEHYNENVDRNTFYNTYADSSVSVILNDIPGSVKSFHTLDYEGSQSKIDPNQNTISGSNLAIDNSYYNLRGKPGWYVDNIKTDKQEGSLNEFIEKEGKWFNYIKGINSVISEETDFGAFNIQGIGILESFDPNAATLNFANNINTSLQIGDVIYFQTPNHNSIFVTIASSNILEYGVVIDIQKQSITVDTPVNTPAVGDYILFSKNQVVNMSSLLGYYAKATFKNNSTHKAELFSVNSEITESSK